MELPPALSSADSPASIFAPTPGYVADLLARNLAGENGMEGLIIITSNYRDLGSGSKPCIRTVLLHGRRRADVAALLLECRDRFLGLVIRFIEDPEREFLHLRLKERRAAILAHDEFYNRRLVVLAKRRLARAAMAGANSGLARNLRRIVRIKVWWRNSSERALPMGACPADDLRLILAPGRQTSHRLGQRANSAPVRPSVRRPSSPAL